MRVLGISLHTPSARSLVIVVMMAGITLASSTVFQFFGVFELSNVVSLTLGVTAGSLASAYGVSVVHHGWRGLVLMGGFVLAVVGIAVLAMLAVQQ